METKEKIKRLANLHINLLDLFFSLAFLEILTSVFAYNIISIEQKILLTFYWFWSFIFIILLDLNSIPKLIESSISKEIDKFLLKISKRSLLEICIITKNRKEIKGYVKNVSNYDYLEIETKNGKRIPIFWNEILYVKI